MLIRLQPGASASSVLPSLLVSGMKGSRYVKLVSVISSVYIITNLSLFESWSPSSCSCGEPNSQNTKRETEQVANIQDHNSEPNMVDQRIDKGYNEFPMREEQQPTSTRSPTPPSQRGVKIIIVSKARYGSTFLGQFLNGHVGILYIFEPIRSVHLMADKEIIPKKYIDFGAVDLLRNILNCQFPTYFVHQSIQKWPVAVYHSRVLRLFCGGVHNCDMRDPEDFSQLCETYQNIALKVTRLTSFHQLKTMATEDGHDLKVIYLVRDPRPVALSRRAMKFRPKLRNESLIDLKLVGAPDSEVDDLHRDNINYDCGWLEENLNIMSNPPDWIKGRLMIIRHEDIAMETRRIVNEMYTFLNIEQPENVKEMINTYTHPIEGAGDNNMETRRNSTQVVHAWRKTANFKDILAVQRVCGDVIERLGYKLLKSEKEMQDIKGIRIF
ncbi:carbohydrate sulfotransferase 1-like [Saccoglossus kowalevskii]